MLQKLVFVLYVAVLDLTPHPHPTKLYALRALPASTDSLRAALKTKTTKQEQQQEQKESPWTFSF